MRVIAPYKVIVSTDKGVIIILSNKKTGAERTYSHFVDTETAAQFAQNIECVLDQANYTDLEFCFICGEPFSRTNKIFRLTNDTNVHDFCFRREMRNNQMCYDDVKDRDVKYFSPGTPLFDFSNFQDEQCRFHYAIQVVSRSVIHLYTQFHMDHCRRHFCLTHDELRGLIQSIRDTLALIQEITIGTCFCCGHPIYVDHDRYVLKSGELVHGKCMEHFIQSEQATDGMFPVKRIRRYDIFDHARYFPYYDPSCFPKG